MEIVNIYREIGKTLHNLGAQRVVLLHSKATPNENYERSQADGVYRLDHALTATQKTILRAFGIDANYVKRKTKDLSDCLNPKNKTVKI